MCMYVCMYVCISLTQDWPDDQDDQQRRGKDSVLSVLEIWWSNRQDDKRRKSKLRGFRGSYVTFVTHTGYHNQYTKLPKLYVHTYIHRQGITINITQTFNWYEAAQGSGTQRGGAYIFRPNHTDPSGNGAKCVNKDCNAVLTVIRNALCTEVRQVFST